MNIKESVTPSGVAFSVRHLIGDDQDLLTKAMKSDANDAFDQMLTNAIQTLGDKDKNSITKKVIQSLLSNDRKFILVTIRQHTLDYKKEFDFKYEWPLQTGKKDKEVFEYSVNFTHENFPVKPYYWVEQKIAELEKEAKERNEEFKRPDGHVIPFPVMYDNYSQLRQERKFVTIDSLPKSGLKIKYELLDGEIEYQFRNEARNDMRINLMLDMRKPKIVMVSDGKERLMMYETSKQHVVDLEFFRDNMQAMEGNVDTALSIKHQTDPSRVDRVDLVALPVFFFPSLGR